MTALLFSVRHSGARVQRASYDVQLHIGESIGPQECWKKWIPDSRLRGFRNDGALRRKASRLADLLGQKLKQQTTGHAVAFGGEVSAVFRVKGRNPVEHNKRNLS